MTPDFQQYHASLAAHDDHSINPSGNPSLDQQVDRVCRCRDKTGQQAIAEHGIRLGVRAVPAGPSAGGRRAPLR